MNHIIIQGKGNSIYDNRSYLGYKEKCKKRKKEEDKSPPKPSSPEINEIILACGREVNLIREENIVNTFNNQLPIVIARVSIDTSSLCNPIVKIDFSTLIEVRDLGVIDGREGIALRFRLKKTCNKETYTLKNYEFKRVFIPGTDVALINETRDSFSFTYCDEECSCHNGCCIYTVELYEIQTFGIVEKFIVSNSAINAIAYGKSD